MYQSPDVLCSYILTVPYLPLTSKTFTWLRASSLSYIQWPCQALLQLGSIFDAWSWFSRLRWLRTSTSIEDNWGVCSIRHSWTKPHSTAEPTQGPYAGAVGGALILTGVELGTCHEGPQDPGGTKDGELIKRKKCSSTETAKLLKLEELICALYNLYIFNYLYMTYEYNWIHMIRW